VKRNPSSVFYLFRTAISVSDVIPSVLVPPGSRSCNSVGIDASGESLLANISEEIDWAKAGREKVVNTASSAQADVNRYWICIRLFRENMNTSLINFQSGILRTVK